MNKFSKKAVAISCAAVLGVSSAVVVLAGNLRNENGCHIWSNTCLTGFWPFDDGKRVNVISDVAYDYNDGGSWSRHYVRARFEGYEDSGRVECKDVDGRYKAFAMADGKGTALAYYGRHIDE